MTAPSPGADKLDKAVLKIASVTVLGAIMAILDTTVVSVALTTFQTEWNATTATVAWTMTGYTLAMATVIPLTGWAADRFGTKRLYLASIAMFLVGSILCAMAWSIGSLIAFRVVQGLGGGMLMPLGMTIVTRAAGPTRVGRVMAVLGIPMLLGPICGPILGGWLIQIASWHWIFLINVPIGIFALYVSYRVLAKDVEAPSESFDFVGMLLLSPGLALFLFGVSSVPEVKGIAHARVLIPAIVGVLLMAAFVWHALRKDHPLIDLRLFRHRGLSVSVITMSLFAIGFFGAMLLFPVYFQMVRGATALEAGLLLAPQGLGAMITMPIAGRLVDKYGARPFVLVGLTVITAGLVVFTQLTDVTSYGLILPTLFVMGLGMGMTMMPIMSAALASLSHAEVARGSTLMNIIQQSAGSVGTALMSVILTNHFLSRPALEVAQLMQDAGLDQTSNPADVAAVLSPEQLALLPTLAEQIPPQMGESFAATFVVAAVVIGCTLIPALFLPKRAAVQSDPASPIVMH